MTNDKGTSSFALRNGRSEQTLVALRRRILVTPSAHFAGENPCEWFGGAAGCQKLPARTIISCPPEFAVSTHTSRGRQSPRSAIAGIAYSATNTPLHTVTVPFGSRTRDPHPQPLSHENGRGEFWLVGYPEPYYKQVGPLDLESA
jgi:hypothetical protein